MKRIFLAYFALNKKIKNLPIFEQIKNGKISGWENVNELINFYQILGVLRKNSSKVCGISGSSFQR